MKHAINICQLLHDTRLPEQRDGQTRFRDFHRDPNRMPSLFEAFVRNFYQREQSHYTVGAIQLEWEATGSAESLAVLPIMRTDVSLHSPEHSLIIDCKFYQEALAARYEARKLRSTHLYQLYAYLRNAERKPGWEKSDGLLLYPVVDEQIDYRFQIEGRELRAFGIDLRKNWQEIHADLLGLLPELAG